VHLGLTFASFCAHFSLRVLINSKKFFVAAHLYTEHVIGAIRGVAPTGNIFVANVCISKVQVHESVLCPVVAFVHSSIPVIC